MCAYMHACVCGGGWGGKRSVSESVSLHLCVCVHAYPDLRWPALSWPALSWPDLALYCLSSPGLTLPFPARLGFALGNQEALSALEALKGAIDFNQYLGIQRMGITCFNLPQDRLRQVVGWGSRL